MGHANRSRFHNALSLDAQSRRIRFPSARWWESDTNPHRVAECYGNSNSDGYADSNSNSNPDTETYSNSETCSYAEAASYAAAAAIRPLTSKVTR